MNFLLVDDHHLFLEGMRHMLERMDNEVHIDTTDSVQGALTKLQTGSHYDLILLDLSLPEVDGFSLLKSLQTHSIVIPVIAVSSASDVSQIRKCLQYGASGFINKIATSDEMMQAIQTVLSGNIALPENLGSNLDIALRPRKKNKVTQLNNERDIGARQIEVLELMNDGLSNKKIAETLDISEATVKYHVQILFKHFNVKNRISCLLKASEHNLLS